VITVRVNSMRPNIRWYSKEGIALSSVLTKEVSGPIQVWEKGDPDLERERAKGTDLSPAL